MRFGSAFAYSAANADAGSFANPNFAALLKADCTVLVPENELKWEAIRPSATGFDFTRIDAMLAFAQANTIAVRGHTLLWYLQERFPQWLRTHDFGTDPRTEARRLVREHVQTVTRRFAGTIQSWDVVNEAIVPATGALRTNALSMAVGGDTSLLDLAFVTAREELPTAELVYNDYMDSGTPNHRQGVLTLLKGFRDRGIPVDTLGIQSHLGFYSADSAQGIATYNRDNMKPFLDQVVAMGYKLKVTELDVNDAQREGTIAARDADSAVLVRSWLDMMMGYPQLNEVLTWGLNDKYSWLQSAEFGARRDGLPKRPLPYDAAFQPKPMRQAIVDAFMATSRRT
jgi:endo-1,4-beta-xylanase